MRKKKSNKLSFKLKQEFLSFSQLNLSNSTAPAFFSLLNKKIEKTPLRANFAVHIYEYLKSQGGQKNGIPKIFFTQQFPFILEVTITIQYYHNQIIDGKADVVDNLSISNNLILGNLLKEQLYRYMEQLKIPKKIRKKLIKSVRKIFECVDIGQYLEKNHCTYDAFREERLIHPFQGQVEKKVEKTIIDEVMAIIHQYTPLDQASYQDFLQLYLNKIYMMNGVLFREAAEFLAEVMGTNDDLKKKAVQFSTYFGLVQQIVNDNCDYVPSKYKQSTVEKTCKDALSDLRNKSVTLPFLIHYMRHPNGRIVQDLNRYKSIFYEDTYFLEITHSHSIYYAMTCGKKLNKMSLTYLGLKIEEKIYKKLRDLCNVAEINRFYKIFYFHNRGECYKKYKPA